MAMNVKQPAGCRIERAIAEEPVPVLVDRYPCAGTSFSPSTPGLSHKPSYGDPSRHIDIGLINNMPDAAMEATVRQFAALIGSAAPWAVIHLKLFSLPGVPSSDWRHQHLNAYYSDFQEFWDTPLDGVIVTGTEPRAADLTTEPYWADLAKIVDWAEENTTPTVWSCLAAHAAVLHLDGIRRSPLGEKCFGLFEHVRASDHWLLEGLSSPLLTPHSRWNEISEEELTSSGYRVLSKSTVAGVDIFVRERKCLFLFVQGHPEYEADTLAREHRRDVGRFLRGERDSYPDLPMQYFDPATTDMLNAFRVRALVDRREELMSAFPTEHAFSNVPNAWHSQAIRTYGNWLSYIAERKAPLEQAAPGPTCRTNVG
jgi:homoserine O-succinyltransferase/O-acetyltransferase